MLESLETDKRRAYLVNRTNHGNLSKLAQKEKLIHHESMTRDDFEPEEL